MQYYRVRERHQIVRFCRSEPSYGRQRIFTRISMNDRWRYLAIWRIDSKSMSSWDWKIKKQKNYFSFHYDVKVVTPFRMARDFRVLRKKATAPVVVIMNSYDAWYFAIPESLLFDVLMELYENDFLSINNYGIEKSTMNKHLLFQKEF